MITTGYNWRQLTRRRRGCTKKRPLRFYLPKRWKMNRRGWVPKGAVERPRRSRQARGSRARNARRVAERTES